MGALPAEGPRSMTTPAGPAPVAPLGWQQGCRRLPPGDGRRLRVKDRHDRPRTRTTSCAGRATRAAQPRTSLADAATGPRATFGNGRPPFWGAGGAGLAGHSHLSQGAPVLVVTCTQAPGQAQLRDPLPQWAGLRREAWSLGRVFLSRRSWSQGRPDQLLGVDLLCEPSLQRWVGPKASPQLPAWGLPLRRCDPHVFPKFVVFARCWSILLSRSWTLPLVHLCSCGQAITSCVRSVSGSRVGPAIQTGTVRGV